MSIQETKFTFYTWDDGWKAKLHLSNGAILRTILVYRDEELIARFKILYKIRARSDKAKNLFLWHATIPQKEIGVLARKISGLASDLELGNRWDNFVANTSINNSSVPEETFAVDPQDRLHGTLVFPTREELDLFQAIGQKSPLLWSAEDASAFFAEALSEGRICNEP